MPTFRVFFQALLGVLVFKLDDVIFGDDKKDHVSSHEGNATISWIPETCPNDCACGMVHNRRSVDCRNIGLDLPPINISGETEFIDLSGNRLSSGSLALLRDLFKLRELRIADCRVHSLDDLTLEGHDWSLGLRILDASNNKLAYLHNRSFIKMPGLQSLFLSNNRIEIIHSEAFHGLEKLTHLDISRNRITNIAEAKWLCQLPHLQRLLLHDNNIHTIPNMSFRCMLNLETLDLSSNQIRTIQNEAFLNLKNLRNLSIADNALLQVPSSSFQNLAMLEDLDLSGNALSEIAGGSFQHSPTLKRLMLNRIMALQLVDEMAFINLTSLEILEMSNNSRLRYIHYNAFDTVDHLSELHIDGCALGTIEEELIQNLPSLSFLDVSSNPLICDCLLGWLHRDFNGTSQRNITLLRADKTLCKGVSIQKVEFNKMAKTCGPRIVGLFSSQVQIRQTDPLRLYCKAVGIPRPHTYWMRNERTVTDEMSVETLLEFPSAVTRDQGNYTCIATSANGRDRKELWLRVTPLNTSLILLRLTDTTATLTWKRIESSREYRLILRRVPENHSSSDPSLHVDIKHYMRSYTISDLRPNTDYEFCIAVKQTNDYRTVNCTSATTQERMDNGKGMHSLLPFVIGIGGAILVGLMCLVASVAYAARRYDRKKRGIQQDVTCQDHMSELFLANMDSMTNMMSSETYTNEVAVTTPIFDEADLDEIRCTASMQPSNKSFT